MVAPWVAVFPGQGSQSVGMGKDLCENFPQARLAFEEASDAISIDLKRLCNESSPSELGLTENTQPALLVTSTAAFRVLEAECGFVPAAAAGHSLGEYSALVACGSLSLPQAARWVRARGQAMQKAVPAGAGGMAAVLGVADEDLSTACARASQGEDLVEPANFNSPGQVVVSGKNGALDRLGAALASVKGAKVIRLAVSAPFHSSLMKPARGAMESLFKLSTQQPGPLKFPYVPNVTAQIEPSHERVLERLAEQMDHPVLWTRTVETLLSAGHTQFVEIGSGQVLQGLIKRIAKPRTVKTLGVDTAAGVSGFAKEMA